MNLHDVQSLDGRRYHSIPTACGSPRSGKPAIGDASRARIVIDSAVGTPLLLAQVLAALSRAAIFLTATEFAMSSLQTSVVVHKFGGAAMADAKAIVNVGDLLIDEKGVTRQIVVTSALQGVTNQLIDARDLAASGALPRARALAEQIRERHRDVALGVLGDGASTELRDTLLTAID